MIGRSLLPSSSVPVFDLPPVSPFSNKQNKSRGDKRFPLPVGSSRLVFYWVLSEVVA